MKTTALLIGMAGLPGILLASTDLTSLTTTDGATYDHITYERTDPDGLYIEYTPEGGGIGMSKVKFTRLTPDLQREFGYDPAAAQKYTAAEVQAAADFAASERQFDAEAASARAGRDARAQQNEIARLQALANLQAVENAAASQEQPPVGISYDDYPYYGPGVFYGVRPGSPFNTDRDRRNEHRDDHSGRTLLPQTGLYAPHLASPGPNTHKDDGQ
jgi:hypothetical protein